MDEDFLILHGWWSNPQDVWIPWLKKELVKKTYTVKVLELPLKYLSTRDVLKNIKDDIGILNENQVIIAHSAGCKLSSEYSDYIIKKHPEARVGGMVYVAPFYEPGERAVYFGLMNEGLNTNNEKLLDNLESETKKLLFAGKSNINWDNVKQNCSNIVCLNSGNDPFIDKNTYGSFGSELDATIITEGFEKAKHFRTQDGFLEFPRLRDIALELILSKNKF